MSPGGERLRPRPRRPVIGHAVPTSGAGEYLGESNVPYPFREGNGRRQRAFTSQLSQEAGYSLIWAGISTMK